MKFFPIKIAIVCLLSAPVLYISTLSLSETYLKNYLSNQIQNILIGDSKPVLDGLIRLEEQIARNIDTYLKTNPFMSRLKVDVGIFVTTETGRIIYPIYSNMTALTENFEQQGDAQEIAKNNYALLNDGLVVKIEISIRHGSPVSWLILLFFSVGSVIIFSVFYRAGSLKAKLERDEKSQLIKELQTKKESQKKSLEQLGKERRKLFDKIDSLNTRYQKNKARAKINEEELFDEIIALEEELNSFIDLKKTHELEISDLKSKIKKYERRKGSKNKRIDFDFMEKRFSALYKNIIMNRKALSGFLNLNDDQQIKAEELLLMLDRSPDKVTIKRKVFSGKKHRNAAFEVLFSYNGRLYFKKNDNNVTEILVIGTKNTQQKDMEFLHSL